MLSAKRQNLSHCSEPLAETLVSHPRRHVSCGVRQQTVFSRDHRVCYERVTDNGRGYASFSDECCSYNLLRQQIECETQHPNGWMTFLYVMLASIRLGVLVFGPLLPLSTVTGLVREAFPYTVKLNDPLVKTLVMNRSDDAGEESVVTKFQVRFREYQFMTEASS